MMRVGVSLGRCGVVGPDYHGASRAYAAICLLPLRAWRPWVSPSRGAPARAPCDESGRHPPAIPPFPYPSPPLAPQGCIELLERMQVPISGRKACVIGRSNIVGMPAALLLQRRDATVTMVHSKTPDALKICSEADIVIAACGVAEMVTGDWIKPGAVVVDVGINAKDDPTAKKGYRLVGDVEFESAAAKASLITPVPGGVGPMTIAMLLQNTLESARRAAKGEKVEH